MAKSGKKNAVKKVDLVDNKVIGNDVSISMEDVLSIAISRAETMMQENVESQKALADKFMAESANLRIEVTNECKSNAQVAFQPAIDALSNGYMGLTEKKLASQIGVELPALGNTNREVEDGSYGIVISLYEEGSKRNDYNTATICQTWKTLRISNGVQTKVDKILELDKQAQKARDEAITWRRKLQNISKLERQYRGRIAEQKLNQTEEGRNVVSTLMSSVQDDILALPSV